jgi:hypothetical protein
VLTPTQLETATTQHLKTLTERIESELTRRALEDKEPSDSRAVVDEKPARAGTLRLELVNCGKKRCKKCAEGPAHGPYWYRYFRKNGKLTSRYIGKTLPNELAL